MISYIILIIAIILLVATLILSNNNNNVLKNKNSELNKYVDELKKENEKYSNEVNEKSMEMFDYKLKADFLDENIVFVLEGYGNYYYTYDQVLKLTQGNEFSYCAYNIGNAQSKGYIAFK